MNKQESTQIVRKIIESRSFNREELEALFFMLHNAENTPYYPYYPSYPYWYSGTIPCAVSTCTGGAVGTGNTGGTITDHSFTTCNGASLTAGNGAVGGSVSGLTVNDASHTTGVVSASPVGVPN